MEKTNYFDIDRISNSDLGQIKKSIAHYLSYKLNKNEPTPEMEFGSAFHKYILEPNDFYNEYAINSFDKRTKEYKNLAEITNKHLISVKDLDLIVDMKNNMPDFIKELIYGDGSIYEKELYFDYKDVECKSKLDILNLDKRLVIDLKTTKDCTLIEKTMNNFDYYRQAAFYKIAVKQLYDIEVDFIFIFAEKESPFGWRAIELDKQYLDFGLSEINYLINTYKEYLLNPGAFKNPYPDYVETIYLPNWKKL